MVTKRCGETNHLNLTCRNSALNVNWKHLAVHLKAIMGTCHYDDLQSTQFWFPLITAIFILPNRLLQNKTLAIWRMTCNSLCYYITLIWFMTMYYNYLTVELSSKSTFDSLKQIQLPDRLVSFLSSPQLFNAAWCGGHAHSWKCILSFKQLRQAAWAFSCETQPFNWR